jgi:hypothetical protein
MNTRHNRPWTVQEEEQLFMLSNAGFSHKYIAEELGRSKNAITNRVHIIRSGKGLILQTHALPKQQELDFGELSSLRAEMTAPDILMAAASHLEERANSYDSDEGERSIPNTVRMFNALTGHNLSEEQGWLFMVCLKLVRSQQGGLRMDSYEDGAAYFALAGESAAYERGDSNES